MDWPPIGSALSPGRGDVRQDREEDVGFEVSNIPPGPYRSIGSLTLPYEDRGGHGLPDYSLSGAAFTIPGIRARGQKGYVVLVVT